MTTDERIRHREAARALQLTTMLRMVNPDGGALTSIGTSDVPLVIKALQLLAKHNVASTGKL